MSFWDESLISIIEEYKEEKRKESKKKSLKYKIFYWIREWRRKRQDRKKWKRSLELQRKTMEKYREYLYGEEVFEMYSIVEHYLNDDDDIKEFFAIEEYFNGD